MKLAKSLLLGSAAGLAVVSGAQAADLPVRKAAPAVEYVRVCSAYGAGFFFIPGTETCLRVSGRVRAEYRAQEAFSRADAVSGFRGRGRVNFDARTQTAYGTLRTFIRYESTFQSGTYSQGFGTAAGGTTLIAGNAGFPIGATNSVAFDLNKAFIQFAGITAGRATSFFDFYANDLNWSGLPTGSDTYGNDPVVFAYTASFGQGFSATISAEDPSVRRNGFASNVGFTNTFAGGTGNIIAYGGQRMPDVVGALRVDQAWGSAQLSGAVHQLFAVNRVGATFGGGINPGVIGAGSFVDTEYGFAVSGGLKVNLPMIAAGDVLWLQATYSDGATSYTGFGGNAFNQGRVNLFVADAVVDAAGNVRTTEIFNVHAAFLHYWTPQVRQAIFGTYGRIDVAGAVQTSLLPGGFGVRNAAFTDAEYFQIGSNLIYSPVRDLDIGVEILYREIDPRRRIREATPALAGVNRFVGDEGTFEGRLRIQRDF